VMKAEGSRKNYDREGREGSKKNAKKGCKDAFERAKGKKCKKEAKHGMAPAHQKNREIGRGVPFGQSGGSGASPSLEKTIFRHRGPQMA